MKICPLMLIGRSKSELAYIRGHLTKSKGENIKELTCLETNCAWYDSKCKKCATLSAVAAIEWLYKP